MPSSLSTELQLKGDNKQGKEIMEIMKMESKDTTLLEGTTTQHSKDHDSEHRSVICTA
jgi:hypothetical protein